jgi:hypothetical protein
MWSCAAAAHPYTAHTSTYHSLRTCPAGTSLQPLQQPQQQQQVPPLLSRDDDGNFEVDRSAIENFLRPPAEELPEDIEVRVPGASLCYKTCYFDKGFGSQARVRMSHSSSTANTRLKVLLQYCCSLHH